MTNRKTVKIAVVLPKSYFGEEEWKNAKASLKYLDDAVKEGAELVCFPEGYPGPASGPLDPPQLMAKPIDALCEKAKEYEVYITASDVEKNPNLKDTYFLTLKLISPEGEIKARYVRVQPDTPPLNAYLYDGKAHLLPGKEFMVIDTRLGNIGLEICSELWVPEISRILMLKGAEIIIAPIHGAHSLRRFRSFPDTWRCIARTRAAENLCYVVLTQNAYVKTEFEYPRHLSLGALVAGPEHMVAQREAPGILHAELNMKRIEYLRSRNYDEYNLSRPEDQDEEEPLACRPGQIWERRPELYAELCIHHKYSFNYNYYKEGLDKWIDEYERIYGGQYRNLQKKFGKLKFKE